MNGRQEIDPTQTPLDPDVTQTEPPLSGTVDDDDGADDERWDENEAPTRPPKNTDETRDGPPPSERWEEEADVGPDPAVGDEDDVN